MYTSENVRNMTQIELVENANSKGLVPDYYSASVIDHLGVMGRYPAFDPNLALKIIRNDPVVKAALVTVVDKILETEWRIEAEDKKSRKKELESKLRETKFNMVLRKAVMNLLLYKNAFIEIVKKGDELTDLNVLEYTLMKINSKDNGDIIGYYQEVGAVKQNPIWTPDKIVHLKLDELTNNVFSDDDIRVLYDTVLIKDYVRQWIQWFFGTNQMRGLYVIKSGANKTKVADFLSHLKASEKDKAKPVIVEGDVIYQKLNSFADEGKTIQDVLNWCDEQILMLLQVPPIAVGMPDQSGRSNSVEQYTALNTRIVSIQHVLEDYFNYDLFPKIGFGKNKFKFGILDMTARKKVFEIVEIMKNCTFSDEAIIEYMHSQNIIFETKEVFKSPEDMLAMQGGPVQGMEGSVGQKSQDSAPSRRRQDATGNSTISKKNTTAMVKNSDDEVVVSDNPFAKYPYTYEVAA